MPGVFSKSSRPKRPGAYFNWEAIQPAAVQASIGSIVALGFTHEWGPENTPVLVRSFSDWQSVFGGDPNNPTNGYVAAKGAFQGSGIGGEGGAGSMVAYRMVSSSGEAAALPIGNTTPATPALTVTAKFPGELGNSLKITIQENAADPLKDELIVLENVTVLETYVYTKTDVASVAEAINANSSWITADEVITGVALAPGSSQALTGGDNGDVLISTDYTAALVALEPERFGVLAFENLIDESILVALHTWSTNLNSKGKRFFTVVGGPADEVASDATTRSGTLNSEDFLNVGMGHVEDSGLLDMNGNPRTLSPAQLAPRIAGVLAARGERKSLTFTHLAGLALKNGAVDADILACFDGGVIVLSKDSNPDSPTRIERGMTTYTTANDPLKPVKVYSATKAVAVMHAVQMELTEWSEATVIGQTTVDDETRAAVQAEASSRLAKREANQVIQPGWTVSVDPDPPPSDDDDFIAFVIAAKFGRSTEQVFWTGRIG